MYSPPFPLSAEAKRGRIALSISSLLNVACFQKRAKSKINNPVRIYFVGEGSLPGIAEGNPTIIPEGFS